VVPVGSEPLLKLDNLHKHFGQRSGLTDLIFGRDKEVVKAVDGVSFDLQEEDAVGVIGESGCGKSTLLHTLIGFHEPTKGEIYYEGEPISEFSKADWKEYRRNVQIIFQDPFNTLDPKLTVKETLKEPLIVHNMENKEERIHDVLERVELSPSEQYAEQFPDQLSGGEKQRVAIARALVLEPKVLLADEPVSMLDVSTQASILDLLSDLVDSLGVSLLYISHDLSTVSYVCDAVNVMYLGTNVETGPTTEIIEDPLHPYTQGLISAIPIPDPDYDRPRTEIQGSAQDPVDIGGGCRFADRCPEKMDICEKAPELVDVGSNRKVSCHLHYDHDEIDNNKYAHPTEP
jgi:peptide/nickel transport system ATP-binding protein